MALSPQSAQREGDGLDLQQLTVSLGIRPGMKGSIDREGGEQPQMSPSSKILPLGNVQVSVRTPARTLDWQVPRSVFTQRAGSAWHLGQISSRLSKVQAQQPAGAGDLGKCKHRHVLGSQMKCPAHLLCTWLGECWPGHSDALG